MTFSGSGHAHRRGMTIMDMMAMFPNEKAATLWFEEAIWQGRRHCGKCGSDRTCQASHKTMPYWCRDCRSYFSVRTGTSIAASNVPLQKWAIAIYLCVTSLKSISSMQLHRDIGVTQKTAWFMLHRIREAWADESDNNYFGPVEADEAYFAGKRKNISSKKRTELEGTGRGAVGKTAVVGLNDRTSNQVSAEVVEETDAGTLIPYLLEHTICGAKVYTDEAKAYQSMPYEHETVKHTASEFVRGDVYTNGVESFWSILKRAQKGTFHKMSPRHLNRYVQEFVAKHNLRELDTVTLMRETAARMIGHRLLYRDLIASNGLDSGARPS